MKAEKIIHIMNLRVAGVSKYHQKHDGKFSENGVKLMNLIYWETLDALKDADDVETINEYDNGFPNRSYDPSIEYVITTNSDYITLNLYNPSQATYATSIFYWFNER
jgi:hypothetical protein